MHKNVDDITGSRYGYLTVLKHVGSIDAHSNWLCSCQCGKEITRTSRTLSRRAKSKVTIPDSCGCAHKNYSRRLRGPRNDLIGNSYGRLTVISCVGLNNSKSYVWNCKCSCGNFTDIVTSSLTQGKTKSCGCIKTEQHAKFIENQKTGYGGISGSYFAQIRKQAKQRKLSLDVTPQSIWELFITQSKKCALTGVPLTLEYSERKNNTASLDRVDSKLGYFIENVQWVHKDINRMKWDLKEEEFVRLCKLVTDYKQGEI